MWKRIKKIFINGEQKGDLVAKTLNRDELLGYMQDPKDIHLKTYSNAIEKGICNICETEVHILKRKGLVWYICTDCNLAFFNPIENFYRDVEIAKENGGVIEHGKYYIRDLPEGFEPPSIN